jgi:hypothetical protein
MKHSLSNWVGTKSRRTRGFADCWGSGQEPAPVLGQVTAQAPIVTALGVVLSKSGLLFARGVRVKHRVWERRVIVRKRSEFHHILLCGLCLLSD